jgi:predicted MFS family arabinose efflux permease
VQAFGWRITFTLFSGVNLLLVLIFYAVVTDSPKASILSNNEDSRPSLRDTLSGIGN